MRVIISVITICIAFAGNAQSTFTEKDAKQVVDTFFDGFHEGDTLKMKSVLHDEVVLQTVYSRSESEHHLSTLGAKDLLTAIVNRPASQKWDERLLDYRIQIDGNLAQVWTPYEFWLNGTFSHCGANAFTLIRTNEGWKILTLIDSRRKSSCKVKS